MRANPHIFHKDTTPDITSITEAVTEADLRVQLAAAYRLVDYFGWTELIYGHLTVRVPGPESHFLINPFGLNYDEVCASNLVKIDVDGDVVEPTAYPVNKAGFVIHSAVLMANSADNKCVMHTHTRDGMAICAIDEGLQPVSMFSTPFFNRVAYHDYEGPSFDIGERDRLLANLGDDRAMILRNHGLLVVGRTIPETFLRLYRLERACQIQVGAASAGTPRHIPGQIAELSGRNIDQYSNDQTAAGMGSLEFAALMRKLDKVDASYRN